MDSRGIVNRGPPESQLEAKGPTASPVTGRYLEAFYYLATVLFDPADCFRTATWQCRGLGTMLMDFASLGKPGDEYR